MQHVLEITTSNKVTINIISSKRLMLVPYHEYVVYNTSPTDVLVWRKKVNGCPPLFFLIFSRNLYNLNFLFSKPIDSFEADSE